MLTSPRIEDAYFMIIVIIYLYLSNNRWADAQKNPRSSEDSKTRSSEKAKRKEYKRKIKAAMMADTSKQADA